VIPILDIHQFTREEIGEILPSSVEAWIRFGDFKEKMGEIEEARFYRIGALEKIGEGEEVRPGWYAQLIGYYRRQGQDEAALEMLREGVEKCPDYAPFRVQLGDYYKKEGISYRAKEEYERALVIEPGNEGYRRRLRKLELDIEFGSNPN
jgi:tetratricopeptide (TPR) repeat protein